MCGRYTLSAPGDLVAEVFDLAAGADLVPRFNIAPTQEAAVVRRLEPAAPRRLDLLRWGLVPPWAEDPSIGNRLINARSETVATKPAFRSSFRGKRCLIPADGFYEWKKEGGGKQPYWIHRRDRRPFAFAGLWAGWRAKGVADAETLLTYTILTTDAHPAISAIHARMPVVLPPAAYDLWLDPAAKKAAALEALLTPNEGAGLVATPVSRRVNNPVNDEPACIEPLTEAGGPTG